jgi:CheY-like chemotaxis protein
MLNGSSTFDKTRERMRRICLLVDDDEDDREIFCMALNETDPSIHCLIAGDGIEALKMLSDTAFIPDYIFLDLNMPLMSGMECLQEIRKRSHLADVPVIIYSTSGSQKDIEESTKLGASNFITKPPRIAVLTEKLAEVFTSA